LRFSRSPIIQLSERRPYFSVRLREQNQALTRTAGSAEGGREAVLVHGNPTAPHTPNHACERLRRHVPDRLDGQKLAFRPQAPQISVSTRFTSGTSWTDQNARAKSSCSVESDRVG